MGALGVHGLMGLSQRGKVHLQASLLAFDIDRLQVQGWAEIE